MVAVSCEYLLAVFENLECVFAEKGEADVVAELRNVGEFSCAEIWENMACLGSGR